LRITSHQFRPAAHQRAASSRRKGFTLPEIVIGILVGGLVLFLGITIVLTAKRVLPGRSISVGTEVLPLAPSSSAFADAVRLHGVLLEKLQRAKATYVFGGSHVGLPALASRRLGAPLQLQSLPSLRLSNGLGLASDAYGFYLQHQAELGPFLSQADPEDFTVLIIGPENGLLSATALLQVRSRRVATGNTAAEQYRRREAVLWEQGGGRWAYSYLERESTAASTMVGARHYWYRYSEGITAVEGPTLAVFPDPWLHAAERTATSPASFSRFVYLLN
jgi:prepilin-type N-terminal cleavage/methylation domain-containing protein